MASDPEPNAVQVSSTPDGITTLTLDRQHRRNAIDTHTATKLYKAVVAFEDDPAQKVLIIHGAHGSFCAGFDLHSLASSPDDSSRQSAAGPVVVDLSRNGGRQTQGPVGPSRMQVSKPVICAVAGYAVAGGLELSLMGDLRIAEEDARFGVFCRRWGVPLIDGGTVRLQAVVGLGRALDMILTGREVSAQEALQMGLANRVVPRGKSLEAATAMARLLVSFPQGCMNLDRRSCYYAAYEAGSFEGALDYEFRNGVRVVEEESIQGARRFSEGAGRHGSFREFGEGKL